MATNFIQDGKTMVMPTVTGAESGDAYVVGSYLPCVLLTDAETADPYNATVQTEGVFDLSAKAHDGSVNSAIAAGDMLYWTDKDTALDKDSSEDAFGIALEAVDAGETATIKVLLCPKAILPDSVGNSDIEAGAISATELASDAVTTAKILDANVTTAKIADANVTSAKLAADTVQTVEKSFTAAQIKTLYSANTNSGLEIVAAPGADKVIEFVSAALYYDYDDAEAYTAANGLTFNVGAVAVSDTVAATFLEATADRVAIVQALSAEINDTAANLANKALYLQEGTTNPTGDATAEDQLLVRVTYRIHDFS